VSAAGFHVRDQITSAPLESNHTAPILKSLPSRLSPRITEPAKTKKQATSAKSIAEQNREPFIQVVGQHAASVWIPCRLGCQAP
jgi:hypothetical protein